MTATLQDGVLGIAKETTAGTAVTVSRFYEIRGDETLDWQKTVVQGQGLRVGSRVARSNRRVLAAGQGGGDFTVECCSKGMGLLWQACLGAAGVSTQVSSSDTYQQVFKPLSGATAPSTLTIQKQLVEAGGTVDAVTFAGCTVAGWEFDFPNNDICTLKVTVDAMDYSTSTSAATASYPDEPVHLFHFAQGAIKKGTLTEPTTTAIASATTAVGDVRGGTLVASNNLVADRFNAGGAGRKSQQLFGALDLTGTLTVEYDAATMRDAMLNETALCLVLTFTGAALDTGNEILQIVLPEIKLDSPLPQMNGTDLVTTDFDFTVLDNLTATEPIWVIQTTLDTAI